MREVWNEEQRSDYIRELQQCKDREQQAVGQLVLPRVGDPYKRMKVMEKEVTE